MKMLRFRKMLFVMVPVLLVIPGIMIFNSVWSSSSRVVLKDQMKIDKIILHDAKGDHACHCFAPIISAWSIKNVTDVSATVSFKCSAPSSYQIDYGTSSSHGTKVPSARPATYQTDGSVTITGLKPSTTYHVGPYAQAQTGGFPVKTWLQQDRGQSDFTFTTTAGATAFTIQGSVLDNKGAGIAGVAVALAGDSAASITTTSNGNYSFANLSKKNYTVTPTKATYTFTPANKAFTGLAANQTQNFVGQPPSAVVEDFSEKPLIYDVGTSDVQTTSANIIWKTQIPTTSQVEYGTSQNYGLKTGEIPELSYDHYLQLFGLKPGTTYHFKVVSGAGLEKASAASSDFSLTTQLVEKRIADKISIFTEPNPCSNKAEFHYNLYQPVNNLTIDVLTLSGKKVAVLEAPGSALGAGWNRISWDVRDRSGSPLVNGLYVYSMKFSKGKNEEQLERSQFMVRR
jgi:hypothetical protein